MFCSSYLLTPYDFSMFLDSDTVFCNHALSGGGLEQFMPRQLSTVWTILNRFEFCGVHGGFIGDVNVGRSVLPGVNTGVVVFRKCDAVKRLVIQWRKALHRRREKLEVFQVNDQGALMKAIDHEKDLKVSSITLVLFVLFCLTSLNCSSIFCLRNGIVDRD